MDIKYTLEQLERDMQGIINRLNKLDARLSAAEQKLYVGDTKMKNPIIPGNILYKDQK